MIGFICEITFNDTNQTQNIIWNRDIKHLSFDDMAIPDISAVSWGIVSNIGRLEFIDSEETFLPYLKRNEIKDSEIRIYLTDINSINTIQDLTYFSDDVIATFYVSEVQYSETEKKLTLSLTDGLTEWQNERVKNLISIVPLNLYDILQLIHKNNGTDVKLIYDNDSNIKPYLETLEIAVPHLKPNSYWHHISKVCEASLMNVGTDSSGNAVFIKLKSGYRESIIIKPYNIFEIYDKKFNYEKSVRGVQVEEIKRDKHCGLINSALNIELHPKSVFLDLYYGSYTPEEVFKISFDSRSSDNDQVSIYRQVLSGGSEYMYFTIPVNTSQSVFFDDSEDTTEINAYVKLNSLEIPTTVEVVPPNPVTEIEDIQQIPSANCRISKINDSNNFEVVVSTTTGLLPTEDREGKIVTDIEIRLSGYYYNEVAKNTKQRFLRDYRTNDIFVLSDNDLIQEGNLDNGEDMTQSIIRHILSEYGKGTECVTIKCAISEYYDEEGEISVSKNTYGNRSFKKLDIVTPYITKKGVEVPYSTYENGNPKKFQIVGIKYHSDGIIWQDLILQELIEDYNLIEI